MAEPDVNAQERPYHHGDLRRAIVSAALEILQMNKCELESFLHNVFSVFVVSHNALCELKHPALVTIEELVKGDRMTALRRGQQPRNCRDR